MTQPAEEIDPVLASALRALCARKAERLVALDLRGMAAFADYFVICHGTSERQVQSLAEDVVERVKAETGRRPAIEGLNGSEWALLDYGDFLVHVFSEAGREYYRLETLWGDAPRIDLAPFES